MNILNFPYPYILRPQGFPWLYNGKYYKTKEISDSAPIYKLDYWLFGIFHITAYIVKYNNVWILQNDPRYYSLESISPIGEWTLNSNIL